ncbi:hypothetical protein V1525DRAFT_395610 [Lipomyces kononenkoae]|uniref:Uncharacterized protein n=1 Tax=Lipomyces kononenkoae TaxID=34357 RepID=A0ACC3T8U1_LIPKO
MQAAQPSNSAGLIAGGRGPIQNQAVAKSVEQNVAAPPAIVALFLARFDTKRGYVFDWQKTASSVIALDMVEFKAFPSGLHHSKEDVIYFTHGEYYSGVSVYRQIETDDPAERFRRMYSLGVLVPGGVSPKSKAPTAMGRLGRCWGHVDGLKELLSGFVRNTNDYGPLETYYSLYGMSALPSASPSTTTSASSIPLETALYRPPRRPFELYMSKLKGFVSTSVATSGSDNDGESLTGLNIVSSPPQILPKSHPAHSLPSFLDTFGPLVFKVWKAALTRERILIVGDVPIEQGCQFVYDIAMLANIPNSIAELLPIPAYRIRPLYAIGIYDLEYIKSLSSLPPAEEARQRKHSPFYGWIAYTTDKILLDKPDLYDVVIQLPPLAASMHAAASVAPAVAHSRPATPDSSEQSLLPEQSLLCLPVNETSGRILYPVVYYKSSPKAHFKASIRDMRRFQVLEAQIGHSIDPRRRWYRQYYGHEAAEEQATVLERRLTASSGSSSGFSTGRVEPSSDVMALLASQDMTDAADEDEIYNDDPELFFSTKTDLQTEQPSWKQLTWLGFLWWASAGEEARIDEEEIAEAMARKGLQNNDTSTSLDHVNTVGRGTRPLLLDDSISRSSSVVATPMVVSNEDESLMYLAPFQDMAQLDDALQRRAATVTRKTGLSESDESEEDDANQATAVAVAESSKQVSIIAFFHRFTARIFSELARLIQEQALIVQKIEPRRKKRNGTVSDDLLLDSRQTLWISKVDMLAMGLDPWNDSDSRFVSTIVERWWGGQVEARRDNEFLNAIAFCC